MSCDKSKENYRPNKVRALEEVVSLLKKHVKQRESEIEGLGKQLKESSDRIVDLEKRLGDKESNQDKESTSTDKETLIDRLKELELEREHIEKKIVQSKRDKNDAQKATNRAANDLEAERSRNSKESELIKRSEAAASKNPKTDEKVSKELEELPKKIEPPEDTTSERRHVTKEKSRIMSSRDQQMLDLSMDNSIMREKLDRMHEISAENLLLQSDVADYHAELSELRAEAKELRAKCYELIEDNRIYKAEVRDLRRYIDLQKANKSGDTRQDLLNKIEYYQMEHDRLLEEVRRLKNRLGDLSPRRSRDSSPRSLARRSPREAKAGVRFNESAERSKSPISDAIAASTASSHAAIRLSKDKKTLSPSAALNLRDLTMERYKTHLTNSHSSINSDNTEVLLKSRLPAATSAPSAADEFDGTSSDEEEVENFDLKTDQKLPERIRSSSRCRSPASSYRSGFRSLSPRMTSTQNDVKDTARDRYATLLKRSLPRRAFAPRSPADLRLGYAIKFTRPGGKLSRGTVRYIGHLASRNEIFIGVELDSTDGKHTGTFQGVKYFSCPINKGIFTPFSKVIMAWE